MKLLGVVGDPIAHSLSPELFDYLFKALSLSCRYDPYRITPNGLAEFVQTSRMGGLLGFNVTIPHKERIVPLLDEIADGAERLGAVNTVVNRDGHLIGHNTDLGGFLAPLRERAVDLADEHAVVLGAGGAARAVVHGLSSLDVAQVTLANRTLDRAEALAQVLKSDANVDACALGDPTLPEALSTAGLLVNATSVGMQPHDGVSPLGASDALHGDLIVYDLVYRPLRTKLLAQAESQGATAIDGLEMLIGQAVASLQLWLPDAPSVSTSLKADLRGYLRHKLLDETRVAD